ncbi:tetratricopeptide repeat protein [Flavobacterium sp. IB48]|uniref:tetratricopeptide repeat protein n=1 Tax=Flavobacterium sp. IB48 TaxID=2779375 RepID=UPI0018E7ECEE|nr:tetratricopeptide repeat protein [Flavobacterium sp. IB48]MBJ2125677.1 tetratricopeptide repeat protein [Flavobacterium sp. IB48]
MKVKTLLFLLLFTGVYAQNQADADKLVEEGIVLHDKGDYEGAIKIYDNALSLDKDNLFALIEKSLTLNSIKKFDEVITISKHAIATHPNSGLENIYVNYGNALDHLNKTEEALKIYEEGIRKFPDYYQLYFNKGICYANLNNSSEAISCFQRSLAINPKHPGSLNAIGILESNSNRIPAVLAFSRFLIVEPQTNRSKKNFENLKGLLMKGVTQTGEKAITINIDSSTLPDSTGVKKENDFSSTDLILSITASLDFDKKNIKKTEVENFIRKIEVICASLDEGKKENQGFYWNFLAPYFIEMKNKKLIEPFAYIAYVDAETDDVVKWHKKNQNKLDDFYEWSKNYKWGFK